MSHTPYQFSHNMIEVFERSAHRLFQHFKGSKVEFLEIGVFEGQTACHMLDNYLTHGCSGYIGIEFDPVRAEKARENIRRGNHPLTKWNVVEGRSDQILAQWSATGQIAGCFDAIYIDGDHRKEAAFLDMVLSWKFLAREGIMLFDDYKLEQSSIDPTVKFGVKEAVLNFLMTLAPSDYDIVLDDYQFAIKRLT